MWATLASTVALFAWWQITKPKPWADIRNTDGRIYSLATGKIQDFGEIAVAGGFLRHDSKEYNSVVCCYEAKTGHILWENRYDSYTDLRGLQIYICIDGAGDVLVTSHKPLTSAVPEAIVRKLSGSTGNLIWAKSIQTAPRRDPHNAPGLIERPVIDPRGNIWLVEFIRVENDYTPQVVLLDGLSGNTKFQRQLNRSFDELPSSVQFAPWPIQIECLEDGGAVVFAIDKSDRQHALRFSSSGELYCHFSILFSGDERADPLEIRRYVDEKNRRIITVKECWRGFCTSGNKGHVHAACFSLEDGRKIWESVFVPEPSSASFYLAGHLPELGILRMSGDLELRSNTKRMEKKTNWYRWSLGKGIPMPESAIVPRSYRASTLIDGTVSNIILDSSSNDWFQVQASEAGTATRETFVFGYDLFHYSEGRVRCKDARRWLPNPANESSTEYPQCFLLVKTPAGSTIMARDPNDRYPLSVYNWQVLGKPK